MYWQSTFHDEKFDPCPNYCHMYQYRMLPGTKAISQVKIVLIFVCFFCIILLNYLSQFNSLKRVYSCMDN